MGRRRSTGVGAESTAAPLGTKATLQGNQAVGQWPSASMRLSIKRKRLEMRPGEAVQASCTAPQPARGQAQVGALEGLEDRDRRRRQWSNV
eukprot:8929320-Alexandrium_andersonii.AAC.1